MITTSYRRLSYMSVFAVTLYCAAQGATVLGEFTLPPERTLPVDPVELVAGREVQGVAEHSVERDGIEYRFVTLENKAIFEKEPAKFEVYEGGACGRMGALAGMGDARRYAVHAGRIYFFASDGCRAGFLKDPNSYIEVEDEKVFGSNEQVERGRAAIDRLVTWAGGAERLRGVTSYRAAAARTEKHGKTEYNITNETAIVFPDQMMQKEAWNQSWFSTTVTSEGAAMATSKSNERIAASRAKVFKRTMSRWPIVILKAYVDGSPKADCPGLIVIGDGEGLLSDVPVEYVKIWLNGAAARLTIEKATGKLLQIAFRGRENTMKVAESVRTYTAWSTVDGVTLPIAYTITFDSNEQATLTSKIDQFEVNKALPADCFVIPKNE